MSGTLFLFTLLTGRPDTYGKLRFYFTAVASISTMS